MKKIKFHFLLIIISFSVIGIMAIPTKFAKAETATTFPVGEAGIAAYVKLNSVDITDLTEALNYFYQRKKQESTYVIGTMQVENVMGLWTPLYSYPHLYIGLDGWVVAYYLKDEEASRIMQWKDYTTGAINTTTLKDAIDIMAYKIGVSYSDPIKYYDFEFPEANKMTLIAEKAWWEPGGGKSRNSFSVTVPGVLYEGAYSLYLRSGVYYNGSINLSVDGATIYSSACMSCSLFPHGYYDVANQLSPNTPHFIELYVGDYGNGGGATALIYKN